MKQAKNSIYYFLRSVLRIVAPLYKGIHSFCKTANHLLLSSYHLGQFKSIGKRVRFYPENSSFTYKKISLGNNVFIGRCASFRGTIEVGNDVMFGPFSYITDGRHQYENVGMTIESQGAAEKKKITIEDDCWIGQRTFVGGGVRICEGSVIGAMSVVTKDVPPYTINVGNPCRPISYRYSDEDLLRHLQIKGRSADEAQEVVEKRARGFLVAKGE